MDLFLGLFLGLFTGGILIPIAILANKEFQDGDLFLFQDGVQYEF